MAKKNFFCPSKFSCFYSVYRTWRRLNSFTFPHENNIRENTRSIVRILGVYYSPCDCACEFEQHWIWLAVGILLEYILGIRNIDSPLVCDNNWQKRCLAMVYCSIGVRSGGVCSVEGSAGNIEFLDDFVFRIFLPMVIPAKLGTGSKITLTLQTIKHPVPQTVPSSSMASVA